MRNVELQDAISRVVVRAKENDLSRHAAKVAAHNIMLEWPRAKTGRDIEVMGWWIDWIVNDCYPVK